MKIYTKTGDKGTTQLFSGERVSKNSLRVELYGTVDELQSVIILASKFNIPEEIQTDLGVLIRELYVLSADFATVISSSKQVVRISEDNILRLEQKIDEYFEKIPKTKEFILDYKTKGAAFLNNARTVCRRAERLAITVNSDNRINENIPINNNTSINIQEKHIKEECKNLSENSIRYLNRLSDYLFAAARYSDFLCK